MCKGSVVKTVRNERNVGNTKKKCFRREKLLKKTQKKGNKG